MSIEFVHAEQWSAISIAVTHKRARAKPALTSDGFGGGRRRPAGRAGGES
ncbi:hypothetical protein [Sphingomonas soli]|nr:hypothetical protein [Sphingomonas soli]